MEPLSPFNSEELECRAVPLTISVRNRPISDTVTAAMGAFLGKELSGVANAHPIYAGPVARIVHINKDNPLKDR